MSNGTDLPSLLSLEGLHSYVERHYGSLAAKVVGGIVILGVCALCLGLISTLVSSAWMTSSVALSGKSWPTLPAWLTLDPVIVQPVVSLLLMSGLVWWVSRKLKRIRVAVIEAFSRMGERTGARLERLEQRAASVESIEKALGDVHERLVRIEPEPLDIEDPDSFSFATVHLTPEQRANKRALMRLLDSPKNKVEPVGGVDG